VSPVARTREGFRSTTRFGESGRVLYARVNFSETGGGGGDTGDTHRTGDPLLLRRHHAARDGSLGGQRLAPASRQPVRTAAPVQADPGGTTMAASASSGLPALVSRVRRVGLNGRFDPEAALSSAVTLPARCAGSRMSWRAGRANRRQLPAAVNIAGHNAEVIRSYPPCELIRRLRVKLSRARSEGGQ
jgi:hypothetical protein